MRLQHLTTWLLLALLAVPLAIGWCVVWLCREVLSPRSDLPLGGEPRPTLVRQGAADDALLRAS